MTVVALPIPAYHRSVKDALATAGRSDFDNVLILSETDGGMVMLHATDLTAAQILWMLECGKKLLMPDYEFARRPPKEIA